jgi:membrane protein required for colicin V production
MNWLDIVIIICIIIGIVHGLANGIVKQVISLVALFLAIFLSGTIANAIRSLVQPHIQSENPLFSPNVENALYYVVAFILIVSLFGVLAHFVNKIINYTPIEFFNRLFGALFGPLMWALCLSIALNFIAVFDSQSQIISKPVKENSRYYEQVRMLFPTVYPYIKDFFKH